METQQKLPARSSSDFSRGYSLLKRLSLFFGLALTGGVSDLWTKAVVFDWLGFPGESPRWWLLDGYVGVETAVNIGALFGMGAGFGLFFAFASILAGAGIFIWLFFFQGARSLWLTVAMGLVAGGIIGNLYDRLGLWYKPGMPAEWKSGVRDWILLAYGEYTWPNFNIADSLLVVGAIMLAWHSLTLKPPQEATLKAQKTDLST